MSTFLNREIAARAGRTTMARKTSAQRTAESTAAGNALLLQMGTDYYAAMGRRSAQLRRERSATLAPCQDDVQSR